jgi:hypothetical protein
MAMWQKIKFYFVSLLIIGLAAMALFYRYFPQRPTRRTVDVPAVLLSIQHLKQLVTVRYNIQKAIGLEEQKVPFGTEKVLIMVQAKVSGGIDLGELGRQDVTDNESGLTIRLPAPHILDVSIDDKATKVWDRSISWWAVWVSPNPDLEQSARRAALESVQQAALDMGILSNAQENAEITIREFLNTVGISNVNFNTSRPL